MKRPMLIVALLLAGACATTRPAPKPVPVSPKPPATPAPTARPTPTPVPTPPAPPRPVPLPPSDVSPPLVRVLLSRSAGPVAFPQPGRPYRVTWEEGAAWLWGPLQVGPSAEVLWQVGAWRDEGTAAAAVAQLRDGLGGKAAVEQTVDDAGLRRVRVRWTNGSPADAGARLAALGFADAFIVPGAGRVRLNDAAGQSIEARRILLEPNGSWPTAVGRKRYRGRFRLRASAGRVLVINELNLEAYLRGVVPGEMGPLAFPQLDALKAQAVAARTYAVAHLGDHADEGYDLCATPACQVYGGTGIEHRLTDRAVQETAGLIAVFDGKPIDAMYTSTCGGHTEDAASLFPDRAAPYLKGVACAWERPLELEGDGRPAGWMSRTEFAADVARQALGLANDPPPAALVAAVAKRCAGRARLGKRNDLEDFAARLLEAAGLDRVGVLVGDRASAVQRTLDLADLYGVDLAPAPAQGWQRAWAEAAALAVLRIQGIVSRDRGEAVPRPDGVGIFPRRAESSQPLPSPLPLYERWNDEVRRVVHAEILPGTTLERWRDGEEVLALVVRRSGGGGEADRRSAWRSWIRELSWRQLAARLGIPNLARIEVTQRSASGRVVGFTAEDASGRRKTWTGFDVRGALGLPETLFTFHRIRKPDGTIVVRFLGRGWGHGVGLCQNGAYGLARAGMTFDRILATYYPGTALISWSGERAAASGG